MPLITITLTGQFVQLETLQIEHAPVLKKLADLPEIWAYTPIDGQGTNFDRWIEKAITGINNRTEMSFIVRCLSNQEIIGSTRYYEIEQQHARLSIGYTWYHPSVWGTQINTESKLLLLTHAFETLKMQRVAFYVDALNTRSRAAVKKLGAIEEGILRKHMIVQNGRIRDTVIYSITNNEWPQVKNNLQKRLTTFTEI